MIPLLWREGFSIFPGLRAESRLSSLLQPLGISSNVSTKVPSLGEMTREAYTLGDRWNYRREEDEVGHEVGGGEMVSDG